ncbi:MAG: SpoIID/LytB domain-containing protein, partial [Candidatus Omnitrophica bacterium]|nr:SpoIID/LytB domain-containing protein [Candidatus Omnitrophota bacterium]
MFLFILLSLHAETVRICVWEGTNRPSIENYKGKYRGQLSLARWGGKYAIINTMDIEEYLFGVIGKEMDKSW